MRDDLSAFVRSLGAVTKGAIRARRNGRSFADQVAVEQHEFDTKLAAASKEAETRGVPLAQILREWGML